MLAMQNRPALRDPALAPTAQTGTGASKSVLLQLAAVFLVGAIYVMLLTTYLGPLNGFWSTDQGIKLIQVQSLLLNRYSTNALTYPGNELVSDQRFSPLRGQFLQHGGATYSIFSPAFALLSSPFFFVLNYPGLYVVPIGSSLLLLMACMGIGRHLFNFRWRIVAVLICGLASPLLFYSLVFWEHMPAAFLTTLALWIAVEAYQRSNPRLMLGAGISIGVAVWLRNETLLCLPALGLAILILRPSQLIRYGLWLGIGAILTVGPLLLFNQWVYGAFVGAHVIMAGASNYAEERSLSISSFVDGRRFWADNVLAPLTQPWLLAGCATLLGLHLLIRLRPQSSRPYMWRYASLGLLIVIGVNILVLLEEYYPQTSLLLTFPFVLLCLLAPARGDAAEDQLRSTYGAARSVSHLVLWFGLFYILLAWSVKLPYGGLQWGPRMLLPAIPPLTLAGVWRVADWFQAVPSLRPRSLLVGALLTLVTVSLCYQAKGIRELRKANFDSHTVMSAVAQNTEHVVVTDIWYAPLLIAPLFYEGRLIYLTETIPTFDALLTALSDQGITHFYFLGAQPDFINHSTYRQRLVPDGEPLRLPIELTGVTLNISP